MSDLNAISQFFGIYHIIFLFMMAAFLAWLSGWYKAQEKNQQSQTKQVYVAYRPVMALISGIGLCLISAIFIASVEAQALFLVILFSILRGIFWSYWSNNRAKSNITTPPLWLTVTESYNGSFVGSFLYAVKFLILGNMVGMTGYLLMACFTLFWALFFTGKLDIKNYGKKKINTESYVKEHYKNFLGLSLVLVSEVSALVVLQIYAPDNALWLFSLTMGISSFISFFIMLPRLIEAIKGKNHSWKSTLTIGGASGIHDILYFISFGFIGPFFLVVRKWLAIYFEISLVHKLQGKKDKDKTDALWRAGMADTTTGTIIKILISSH